MSIVIKVIVFSIILLPSFASAGSYQGKITSVFPYNGKVYVRVASGGWDNSNTCTTGDNGFEVWLDPAEEFGKSLLSVAMVAKTTDRLVWVVGNGSCSSGPQGQAEKINGIDLKG